MRTYGFIWTPQLRSTRANVDLHRADFPSLVRFIRHGRQHRLDCLRQNQFPKRDRSRRLLCGRTPSRDLKSNRRDQLPNSPRL
jgi:hypothetical protein